MGEGDLSMDFSRDPEKDHTLSVLVENKPGVLTRVTALLRGAVTTSHRSR